MESISLELLLAYIGIAIAVFALIAGFGVAVGMDARTQGEYQFAVTCFVISALMIVAIIGWWDVTTQAGFTKRGLTSIFCIALVCFALSEVVRWTRHRHEHARASAKADTPGGSEKSNSHLQEPEATAENNRTTDEADTVDTAVSPVEGLTKLGWTVQPGKDEIQFEIVSKPLPSMRASAAYFRKLHKPFR